jgi:hypothetical protein
MWRRPAFPGENRGRQPVGSIRLVPELRRKSPGEQDQQPDAGQYQERGDTGVFAVGRERLSEVGGTARGIRVQGRVGWIREDGTGEQQSARQCATRGGDPVDDQARWVHVRQPRTYHPDARTCHRRAPGDV